jgi:DNA-binding transcriptional MerR regulator
MPKTLPSPSPAPAAPRNEYTVDELARVTDSTVRNVRAYQDRGLLAPPEKRGRVGVYDETHVSRLKLINHLLARGYTLANIQDLIKAVDEGHDLRSILGLETAIGSRWSRERPRKYSLLELLQMFGDKASPGALSKAVDLGLLERKGLSFVANSPAALSAGATMANEGIPLADLLDAVRISRPHFAARRCTRAGRRHLAGASVGHGAGRNRDEPRARRRRRRLSRRPRRCDHGKAAR